MFRAVFVLAFLLNIVNIATSDDTERIHNKCHKETGVDKERIPNAMKGEFPEDEVFKCYIKCIIIEMGVMDKNDGKFDFSEKSLAALPEAVRGYIKKMGDNCAPLITSEDFCQRAFDLHKCAYEFDPENYFLF